MTQMIFVNIPITDVPRSRAFFSGLGYSFNEQFSGDDNLCLVVSDSIYVMMVKPEFLAGFLDKPVGDPKQSVTALISLNFDSAQAVRAHCEKAFELGGRNYKEPTDLGFMFQWGFEDPDGNIWEAFWMNPDHVQG